VEEGGTLDTYLIFSNDSTFHIFRAVNRHNVCVRGKYFYAVSENYTALSSLHKPLSPVE
jgi:hypothetical protein